MIRTQIQLTESQARRLRQIAQEHQVSLAEVIRRCIERSLEAEFSSLPERYARAGRLIGKFQDRQGKKDISTAHDAYLDRAFE